MMRSVITLHKLSIISLHIKQSNTDQRRKGLKVYMGKTNGNLCPVSVLVLYLELHSPHAWPLFQWSDGLPLSRPQFIKEVKTILVCSVVSAANYSGHSFRSGAAMMAAAAGLEDSVIQMPGRWKSAAYLLYVRIPPTQLAQTSVMLASCPI